MPSPPRGSSTLTTSAPRSASSSVAYAPGSSRVRSRTRMPSSGRIVYHADRTAMREGLEISSQCCDDGVGGSSAGILIGGTRGIMPTVPAIDLTEILKGIPRGAWVAISSKHERVVAYGSDIRAVLEEAKRNGEVD